MQPNEPPRLISLAETCRRCSFSESTLRRLSDAEGFPSPVRISHNRIAFLEAEVTDWITSRPRVKLGDMAPETARDGAPPESRLIASLRLGARAHNFCANEEIKTVDELAARRGIDILRTPNCGRATYNELREGLARFGLDFVEPLYPL